MFNRKKLLSFIENKIEIKADTKDSRDKAELTVGYENLLYQKRLIKSDLLSNKIEQWQTWKISNFEMLMWLNLMGNRSYLDISQYPVFPWIITNFTSDNLNLTLDVRQMNLPMGMMEIDQKGKGKERKSIYIETFNSLKSDCSQEPYHYGSHYSNPMYVAHFLTRVFPFSHIAIELQGDKFDDPNRLFNSLSNSFLCASSTKGDVRELIPEIFYFPEMLLNINNLNMGTRTDMDFNHRKVGDVEVPEWSNSDHYKFIIMMKQVLESPEVSYSIHQWIDLIFGYKQSGKEGEEANNLFIYSSYEDAINLENEDNKQKPYLLRMVEFGLTPTQLFFKQFQSKTKKENLSKIKSITDSKDLKAYGNANKSKNMKKSLPIMISLKVLDNDKILCVYNNNTYNIYR